ncbi:hypothetical protein [Hydrogenophaga defluvii]|uniref:Uncharacterized protein n=1 Tax=Hydrogenophaga defluvii TaxID=249410 RepID=A0ABW2SGT5_9BURK
MKTFLTLLVVVLALVSAFCWAISARATVLASNQSSGYGALLGGDLIAKGPSGERIDLHATLVKQSRWNRYAAISAAICAIAQAALFAWFTT